MRLSTREVNMHNRLSKSPTQVDWSVLCSSRELWPPLLPSFSTETAEALDHFVQGFISARIEHRCGQLSSALYRTLCLPQWTLMAEERAELMEHFFALHSTRLDGAAAQRLSGAFERLKSALRDARQDCAVVDKDQHNKKITFARPVAHRLIRRSQDRFSLRSITEVDESVENSSARLSHSPPLPDLSEVPSSTLRRPSLSPIPYADLFLDDIGVSQTVALPVEERPGGDRFTGRASGVYYGNMFHIFHTPPTASHICEEAAEGAALPSTVPVGWSTAPQRSSATGVARGPIKRSAAWRRWWICFFYYVLLPFIVLLWLCWDRVAATCTAGQR